MKTILSILIGSLIIGCIPELPIKSKKNLKIKKLSGESLNLDQVTFENAKLILDKHCIYCHSANGPASKYNFDFDSEEKFINSEYVTAADLEKSSLFHKIKGAGIGSFENMPPSNKNLDSSEIELLKKWILNMKAKQEYKVSLQILEGSSGIESIGSITLKIGLDKEAPKDILIPINTSGNTQESTDYVKLPPNVIIKKGSKHINLLVNIINDNTVEGLESIKFSVGTYSDNEVNVSLDTINSAVFFISDDDVITPLKQLYTASFSSRSSSQDEEIGLVYIYVEIDKLAKEQLTFPVNITGEADLGRDYSLPSNSVTINKGQKTGVIPLEILNDNEYENDETIQLSLSSVSNNDYDVVLGTSNSITVTITRNDIPDSPPPSVDSFAQVRSILQAKCFSCHSTKGNFPQLAFDFNT